MISASSLNAGSSPHGHSLSSKSNPMPLAIENGRLRVDSQKFLVPSLPVSSRAINGNSGDSSGKRRERSIINGTAVPSENHHHHHHHQQQQQQHQQQQQQQQQQQHLNSHHHSNHHPSIGIHSPNLNGVRRSSSYNHNVQNGIHSSSTSNGQHHLSPHYPSPHLNTSPRKDAHSPMYAGEVSNPGNYPGRSSMPIPCSSPSPASSASPKSLNQSHSPNTSGSPSSRNYSSPQLPPGSVLPSGVNVSNLVPDLSSLSSSTNRLYPGGFHGLSPHPGGPPPPVLNPAFYAAAAAAAGHSIPYPLFGPHNPYSHAAASYMDSLHSTFLVPPSLRSSSSSTSPQQSPRSHSSYLPQHQQQLGTPLTHSTTTTSLHTKLIESVSTSNERHSHNHHQQQHQHGQHRDLHVHSHGHMNNTSSSHSQQNYNRYLANGVSEGSKGSHLEIGMGFGATVPNLPPPGHQTHQKVSHSENFNKSSVNGSLSSSKMWIDSSTGPGSLNSCRDGNMTPTESNGSKEKETDANKDANKVPHGKEGSLKHRILTRSPDDLTARISPKVSKSISFAESNNSHSSHNNSNSSSLSNGGSHHHSQRSSSNSHMNGHHQHHQSNHHQQNQRGHYNSTKTSTNSVPGVLVDSNNAKQGNINNSQTHNGKHVATSNQNNPFLPPSPKKVSAPWNFAVPPAKIDLPPPQPLVNNLSATGNSGESKYLSQNQKPSNQNSNPSSPYLSPAAQQQSNPNSPVAKTSGEASSPGRYQNSAKENGKGKVNGNKERNSSSSSSNSDSSAPVPVEAMPVLNAFKRGSLIQLANGELRPVEDLQTDDFLQSAAISADPTKIIHCTVVSIKSESESQLCKVTLSMGSHKQQVVMEATPEQPFFVLGRGWSSSSPLTTQKILQLSCTPLAVGDVCITLSRIPNGLKASNQLPPKSPSVKSKGSSLSGGASKGRNVSTASSNTAKGSRLSTNNNNSSPTATTTNKLSRKAAMNNAGNGKSSGVSVTMSNGANLSSAMLPPPSPLSLTAPKGSMNNSLAVAAADENERPPSPKKRRWSAPVDNLAEAEAADKDNMTKKENPVRIKT